MCIPVNEDIEGLEGGSVKATEPNSCFGYFYLSIFERLSFFIYSAAVDFLVNFR